VSRNLRRRAVNALARALMYIAALAALVPLSLVLVYTIRNGLPAASHLEFYLNFDRPVGIPGAGIAHALVGTVIMVAIASFLAMPVGIIAGINLVEYGAARWAGWVRLSSDVLVGAPSIAIGLFAYALVVAPLHRFSALSASFALAVLMLPVIVRTTEGAYGLIPPGLREAGLALGLARWRVAIQLLLPAAVPGVVTGCLIAMARAAGETAPLLFTAFGNRVLSLNPMQPMAALPLTVFHDALTPYPELQAQAWGAALVLVAVVLATNLLSRFVLRRQIRLAGLPQ
jgi:phosphate transport system permease protein